ncbi:OsmC family protein [Williamsia deligens]|uniref:OsmC family protein n=1 Tax=Williamsia deligens TaxID=321325 RepID=A0ABW3G6Q5_9NOCA|nr:OsmC family protein [Williamsia deligens]MCP2193414.1 OsmC-like protein [Williamsia deligens]
MDASSLRELQKPLKDTYKTDPSAAVAHVHADGLFADAGITATVDTWAGPVRAGFHPTTGGDGSDACSADMLLQALVGCAGVTFRSVATAMSIDVRDVAVRADGAFDARGTLGIDREAPVGMYDVGLTFTFETDADDAKVAKLLELTERYCVVAQTLGVPVAVRRG